LESIPTTGKWIHGDREHKFVREPRAKTDSTVEDLKSLIETKRLALGLLTTAIKVYKKCQTPHHEAQ